MFFKLLCAASFLTLLRFETVTCCNLAVCFLRFYMLLVGDQVNIGCNWIIHVALKIIKATMFVKCQTYLTNSISNKGIVLTLNKNVFPFLCLHDQNKQE